MKTIKRLFRSRIRWVLSLSALVTGTLLMCYAAFAQTNRASTQHGIKDSDSRSRSVAQSPGSDPLPDGDTDPQVQEDRREWQDQFFGLGSVSAADFVDAVAAARSLPPSPLLHGRRFVQAPATATVWTSPIPPPILNSYGGDATTRVTALGLDPTDSNVVYTGNVGGLARSTNGGATWQYLSDNWDTQAIGAIAVGPTGSTHNHVYVGTGDDKFRPFGLGVYRSIDGGTTWTTHLGVAFFGGTSIRAIAFDPRTPTPGYTVYVGNSSGLWRSTDQDVTWRPVPHPSTGHNGIYDVAVDSSTNPSTLYYTEDSGMFRSTDSGQSWISKHNALLGSRNKLRVVNSTLYLFGPGDPDHNLYKSIDRGENWIPIPEPCPCPNPPCSCVTCSNKDTGPIQFYSFAVDPANPQIILGGNATLYRTDNGGTTWTSIGCWSGPYVHTDQRVIAFSPSTPSVVYEGNDGGVVKSTDAGLTWANLNHNLPGAFLYGVALSRDGTMIGGTQDSGIVFSYAGAPWGPAWYMIFGGDSFHDLIDPLNGTPAYFSMYYDFYFKRFDRATYQSVNIRPTQFDNDPACNFFPTFSMNPNVPTHVIAACQHVVRTLNAPTVTTGSWTTIGQSLADPNRPPDNWTNSVNAACEAPSNPDYIYAIGQRAKLWVTPNALNGNAATWIDRTSGPPGLPGKLNAVAVHPTDPLKAYVACDSNVYKTINMGLTWVNLNAPPDAIYHDVAIDPANPQQIFVSSNTGVFESSDGGTTWANLSTGSIPTGVVVGGLSFNAASRQLAAATIGRGVYLLDLDNVAPVVSITAPRNGDTVRGTINVLATASDNHAVAGVQFKLDGANVGSEDMSSPYSISWNTATSTDGSHTLTAIVRDPANNSTTSASVVVTVNN